MHADVEIHCVCDLEKLISDIAKHITALYEGNLIVLFFCPDNSGRDHVSTAKVLCNIIATFVVIKSALSVFLNISRGGDR